MQLLGTITATGVLTINSSVDLDNSWFRLPIERAGEAGKGYPQVLGLGARIDSATAAGNLWFVLFDIVKSKVYKVIKVPYAGTTIQSGSDTAKFACEINASGRQVVDLLGACRDRDNNKDLTWYVGHPDAFTGGATTLEVWGKTTSDI